MWQLAWFFRKRSIDKKIAKGFPISKQDAYLILKKAISIHRQMIDATWDDPAISGDDELHKEWIFWYKQIIVVVYGGVAFITLDEAIKRLHHDIHTHQYWIDYKEKHPDFQLGYRGSVALHKKWKARWLAIIEIIKE